MEYQAMSAAQLQAEYEAVTKRFEELKGKNLKPYVEDVADMMNSIKNLFFKKQ